MANVRPSTTLAGQLDKLFSLGAIGSLPDDQLIEMFLTRDDPAASDAAFSALVDRHGSMVLSVCQRVLRNPHDAHDAFQATFLVLVRKAASIRRRESIGGWLFAIARRVAVKARVEAARRRHRLEKLGIERRDANDDVMAIGHEPEPDYGPLIAEIDRLPERFRAPVVLHYFEGLSAEAAAERLGCPRGTVLSRLARARERLRRRLEHRGFSLEALMPAALSSGRLFSSATVPSSLVQSTVRAASCLALAGTAIESVVPATVATLSSGVLRNLMFAKMKVMSVLVVFGLAGAAIGFTVAAPAPMQPPRNEGQVSAQDRTRLPRSATPSQASEKSKGESVVIRGQVLDPDRKPVAGARIFLDVPGVDPGRRQASRRLTISRADGRFDAVVARDLLKPPLIDRTPTAGMPVIGATAPGWGPDWARLDPRTADTTDFRFRLRRDDVPIEGLVLGLEGRPLSGLAVSVGHVAEYPPELIEKLRENAGAMNPVLWGEMNNALVLVNDGLISPVQTGSDGRFRLIGVGRDRAAFVLVEGESIERPSYAMVMTSSDPAYNPAPLMPSDSSGEHRLLGPRFVLTVAPGRTIEGVIRDRDTGRPIPGARIRSWIDSMSTSDVQGRFRIAGQPKRADNRLEVTILGQPFIKVEKPVGNSPGLGPVHVDITLKRGIWVEGKVIERATGRPVKAVVQYYPLRDNPHLKECPDASFLDNNVSDEAEFLTDTDGEFRAVALPGAGILTVRTTESGFLSAEPLSPRLAGNVLQAGNFEYQMPQYQAMMPINPGDGERTVIPDIVVVRGRTQRIQILGVGGRPVTGTRRFGHLRSSVVGEVASGAEFTFVHPKPGTDEPLLIVQQDESAGAFRLLKGDEPDPISIMLQPTATVTGRLVDEEGRPRPNVPFVVVQDIKATRFERFSGQPATGPDGRFRIRGLVAGVVYNVDVIKNNTTNYSERFVGSIGKLRWTVNPGETQDWGDVQAKKHVP